MHQGYGARDVVVAGLRRRKPGPGAHPPAQRGRTAAPGPSFSSLPVDRYDRQRQVLPGAGRHRPGAHGQLYSRRSGRLRPGPGLVRLRLSPLFGDLKGLSPHPHPGGKQRAAASDSIRLRDRLVQAAVPCRLEVWTDLWHVFQMFPHEKGHRGHGASGVFCWDTSKESRFCYGNFGDRRRRYIGSHCVAALRRGEDVVVVGQPVQGPQGGPQGAAAALCGRRWATEPS